MIKRVWVRNFKCLRDVTLELGPLTVLIGQNDSGKSSIFDALTFFLDNILAPSLVWDGDATVLPWRRNKGGEVRIDVSGDDGSPDTGYKDKVILSFGANDVAHVQGLATKINPSGEARRVYYTQSMRLQLSADALRLAAPIGEGPAILNRTGNNLPAVLDAIYTGIDRGLATKLEKSLHEAVPSIRGITLPTAPAQPRASIPGMRAGPYPVTGNAVQGKALEFILAGNEVPPVTIPARDASEGALLLTAFLAVAYSQTPDLILIEEPENGLHPARLKLVFDLLRRMSTGEIGSRPRQIIVTTHNPLLLNFAEPSEVRILQRDPTEGTKVTRMDAIPGIEKMRKEFAVGELWYLLGEKALVEGRAP